MEVQNSKMVNSSKYAGLSKQSLVLNVESFIKRNKVIALIDIDQFEVQVHQESWMIAESPPRVVTNAENRIVSVSYEAKDFGIDRNEKTFSRAQRKCPKLVKIPIPLRKGTNRSDSSIALRESAYVVSAITRFLSEKYPLAIFELAGSDEFYIDLTSVVDEFTSKTSWNEIILQFQNRWIHSRVYNGHPELRRNLVFENYHTTISRLSSKNENQISIDDWQEIRMLIGLQITKQIMDAIWKSTQLDCSAGIGWNKLIAKIASGLHKPEGMTLVTPNGLDQFANVVKLDKVKGFGGKIGEAIQNHFPNSTMLSCQWIDPIVLLQIIQRTSPNLDACETAISLKKAVFGICEEPVVAKSYYKGCNVERNLNGKGDLIGGKYSISKLWDIIDEQCDEMLDRLQFEEIANGRTAKLLRLQLKFNSQSTITAKCDIPKNVDPWRVKLWFSMAINDRYSPVDVKSIKISASF